MSYSLLATLANGDEIARGTYSSHSEAKREALEVLTRAPSGDTKSTIITAAVATVNEWRGDTVLAFDVPTWGQAPHRTLCLELKENRNSLKTTCECGHIVRMSPKVLAAGVVACYTCRSMFKEQS